MSVKADIPTMGTNDKRLIAKWLKEGLVLAGEAKALIYGFLSAITDVAAATYDVLVTDQIVNIAYTTTAAVTSVTLLTAQLESGRTIFFKDTDGNAGTNNITFDTEGAAKIDGADTVVIAVDYGYVEVYSDGTNWFIKNKLIA